MSKHKGSILGLVLSLALLSPASALAKAGGTDRPVKGTGVGAVTVLLAPGLPTEVDASGHMTHLGRYTAHFEGGAEIIGGTTFGHGTFTLVAANGDQLTGTATFSGPPPSGAVHPVTAVFTITGGTGRFADANGTITAAFQATPSCFNAPSCPGALVETLEGPLKGQISY
jgi:hypothetical protein